MGVLKVPTRCLPPGVRSANRTDPKERKVSVSFHISPRKLRVLQAIADERGIRRGKRMSTAELLREGAELLLMGRDKRPEMRHIAEGANVVRMRPVPPPEYVDPEPLLMTPPPKAETSQGGDFANLVGSMINSAKTGDDIRPILEGLRLLATHRG